MTMCDTPDWLPDILKTDGEWEETKKRLYDVFESEIKNGGLAYNGRPLFYDLRILEGEYEEAFWHLTHKDWRKESEQFDPRRSERLSWFAPIIIHSNDANYVKCWEYQEGKKRKVNTYIWLEKHDYVIILQKKRNRKGEVYYLISAHYLDGDSRRRNLRKKYERRL